MILNKIALIIGLLCVLSATTISILGIWGYIGDTGLIWRSLSTIGVVLLAVFLSVLINSLTKTKEK